MVCHDNGGSEGFSISRHKCNNPRCRNSHLMLCQNIDPIHLPQFSLVIALQQNKRLSWFFCMRLFNHVSNTCALSIQSILQICLYLDISLSSVHLCYCNCHWLCDLEGFGSNHKFSLFFIFLYFKYQLRLTILIIILIVTSLCRPCVNLMRMLSGRWPTARNSGTGFKALSVGERHCSIRLRTPQGFPAAAGIDLACGNLGLRI